jgi:hypothetical protein
MPSAAPIRPASLAAHPTRGAQLSFAMTLRHFVKPAFSLRKGRYVKTHALWLSGTKNLHLSGQRRPQPPSAHRTVRTDPYTAPHARLIY